MKDSAPDRASLQSIPTMRPRPAALTEKRSSAGASRSQGPHQLAQNTTTAERPREAASRPARVIGRPPRRSRGSSGAARPAVAERLDAKPKIASAARAAPATSIHPSSRRPLGIAVTISGEPTRRGPPSAPGRVRRQTPEPSTQAEAHCAREGDPFVAHHERSYQSTRPRLAGSVGKKRCRPSPVTHLARKSVSLPRVVPSPLPHGAEERGTHCSHAAGANRHSLWRSVDVTRARQLTP
jgi:hypothetical protein